MAKIFNEGDEVTKDWLNGVSKTVTDGLGDNVAPATIRVHINAEQAGAASQVQTNLDTHKADASIHTPSADVVLQAEKGVANGIPTLDGTTKIPATFLPATGGYAGVYDTQALMVAAAAGHTSGEIFLVTDDPTPALNGEYTATATPPASIADYYFNSGAVAAHTHNAADVNVVALGVTVETDSANIHTDLDLKATDADLTTHTGNTDIHFADAVSDGQVRGRKDGAWATIVSGAGDLKSDFSVQMVGTPALGQDIATKASSEAVFTDRLAGYLTNASISTSSADIDTSDTFKYNGAYRILSNNPGTIPPNIDTSNGMYIFTRRTSTNVTQELMSCTSGERYTRVYTAGVPVWTEWYSGAAFDNRLSGFNVGSLGIVGDIDALADNSDYYFDGSTATGAPSGVSWALCITRVLTAQGRRKQICYEHNGDKSWVRTYVSAAWGAWERSDNSGYLHVKLTQAAYDALTPDANTLYYIVG